MVYSCQDNSKTSNFYPSGVWKWTISCKSLKFIHIPIHSWIETYYNALNSWDTKIHYFAKLNFFTISGHVAAATFDDAAIIYLTNEKSLRLALTL